MSRAANAASHLFFAYLRSQSPDSVAGISGISTLPRSLQALLSQTEYPPEAPTLMQTTTTKVVMIVDAVSPTPFALLRRAKHFEYRDDDQALQQFSAFEDPVLALTDECRRVLKSISNTNESSIATQGGQAGVPDASWSRFEDMGFSSVDSPSSPSANGASGLRSGPRSRTTNHGRPTTPSWADFLSSGFADDQPGTGPAPLLLPPDKVLPPIGEAARVHSSQSHMKHLNADTLEPGELASITQFDLDETFWWVWMTSLAGEEPVERKAVFGRCALIETEIYGAKWLVMEEQVKGASPGPVEGAYIAEKKGRFGFTRRGRLGRRKSTGKKPAPPPPEPYNRTTSNTPLSKTSIGPDQQAKIQAAAARLAQKQKDEDARESAQRRGRQADSASVKTNSVLTLQPVIMREAAPAMKWANNYDSGDTRTVASRDDLRSMYLKDPQAGKGSTVPASLPATHEATTPAAAPAATPLKELPDVPQKNAVEEEKAIEAQSPLPAPPPPPPPAPFAASAQEEGTAAAAEVPLPAGTPMDEKPKPIATEDHDTHPAYRQSPTVERKAVGSPIASPTTPQRPAADGDMAKEAARAAFRQATSPTTPQASQPSPTTKSTPATAEAPSKRSPPNKLHKKDGGGGLKKLFGRKRPGPAPTRSDPGQPLSNDANAQVPQGTVKRRLSQIKKKSTPVSTPKGSAINVNNNEAPVTPLAESNVPGSEEVATSHEHTGPVEPRPDLSRVPTSEQAEADQHFSRFDQGPMHDMPAFVPEDDVTDPDAVTPAQAHFNTRAAALLHPQALAGADEDEPSEEPYHDEPYREVQPEADPIPDDMESEQSVDLTRQVSPAQDRWAQIRKNAAERAARMSEDKQSKRSESVSKATDDGETSGEETIESRVARIKARVAELTGNMGDDGKITTGKR